MFEINWTSNEEMFEEFQNNLKKIEGIEKFFELEKEIIGVDFLCWGDDQIDELSYNSKQNKLTVRIRDNLVGYDKEFTYKEKKVKEIFWMIDFYDVELEGFDIAPEHWIDEVYIQQNSDGKYSISFGSGELDFRYSYAKVNRSWVETE